MRPEFMGSDHFNLTPTIRTAKECVKLGLNPRRVIKKYANSTNVVQFVNVHDREVAEILTNVQRQAVFDATGHLRQGERQGTMLCAWAQ